jgi:hypothetical protein
VDRYVSGLNRLLSLDFDSLVPSHGDVLDADAGRKRITESLEWVDEVHTFSSIGTELGAYGGVCLQTMRMARAHLESLAKEGGAEPRWHHAG